MFDNNENRQQFLSNGSRESIELLTKIRKQFQLAVLEEQREQQVMTVIDLMENMQRGWRAASGENAQLREQNARLKRQIENFETALAEARVENQRLNSQHAADQELNAALQLELDQYKERFNRARLELQNATLVNPIGQKSVTLMAPTDEDTEDDDQNAFSTQQRANPTNNAGNGFYEGGGVRIGKRRSNSLGVLPDKKAKRLMEKQQDRSMERLAEEEDAMTEVLPQQPAARMSRQRAVNRSMSEGRLHEDKREIAKQQEQQRQKQATLNKFGAIRSLDMHLSPAVAIGFGSGWTKGRPIEQCGHNFTQINKWFGAAFCHCSICMRGLGGRALKCSDCKLQIHENCRPNAPFPCVPIIPTPQRPNPKQRPRLADLCHETPPKIPGQLIRCVVTLERCFLNTVGLYRVPGCDSEVKKLKENFNSKYVPKLEQLDPETITGYIKKFLRDMREPLIPFSSYKEFCNAVARQDEAQLKYAIETLPIPNRDTLAYLCAHWQKVAMRSNENQMPLENLAKVLGPTVVGTSSKLTHLQPQNNTPTSTKSPLLGVDAARHFQEAGRQCEILFALLNLEYDYWTAFYNYPTPTGNTPTATTGGTSSAGGLTNSNTPGTSTSTLVHRQPLTGGGPSRFGGAR